jgi:SOS response regulatory protein OraA/RecX
VFGENGSVFDLVKMRDRSRSQIAEKIARPQMASNAVLHTIQAVNTHNLFSISFAETHLRRNGEQRFGASPKTYLYSWRV